MQSDQWHPSDIENNNGSEPEQPAQRRPLRAPENTGGQQGEPPTQPIRKPPTQGVMTLDRENGSRPSGSFAEAEQAATVQPEVRVRLREASDRCVSCYDSWKNGQDGEDDLRTSLHDLRRVLARIEIELAANHTDDSTLKPIPIPLHRAHKGSY